VAVFIGKNPWMSQSFPRARVVLKEIAKDPERSMIVIEPVLTDTAKLADFHLRVRPGTDAWCLAAMVGVLVQEDLIDHEFLARHAGGAPEDWNAIAIGFVVSGIVAFIAVKWLLRYVQSHRFTVFAWYRIAFGIVVLANVFVIAYENRIVPSGIHHGWIAYGGEASSMFHACLL